MENLLPSNRSPRHRSPTGRGSPACKTIRIGNWRSASWRDPHFARSPLLSKFLLFVVAETLEGRGNEITEHQIGVQVFDRPADYRTLEDNIVRNYARQLRKRLAEHFADQGNSEPVAHRHSARRLCAGLRSGLGGQRQGRSGWPAGCVAQSDATGTDPPARSGGDGNPCDRGRSAWPLGALLAPHTARRLLARHGTPRPARIAPRHATGAGARACGRRFLAAREQLHRALRCRIQSA